MMPFHAYVTCFLVHNVRPYTVALTAVGKGTSLLEELYSAGLSLICVWMLQLIQPSIWSFIKAKHVHTAFMTALRVAFARVISTERYSAMGQ